MPIKAYVLQTWQLCVVLLVISCIERYVSSYGRIRPCTSCERSDICMLPCYTSQYLAPLDKRSDSREEHFCQSHLRGGCFWCMEAFEEVPGVLSVTSGYIGGHVPNPTYDQVSAGKTGHTEAIEVLYDPARVNYSNCWRYSGTTLIR